MVRILLSHYIYLSTSKQLKNHITMKILEKLRTQFMLIVGIVGIIWIILLSIPFLIWLML